MSEAIWSGRTGEGRAAGGADRLGSALTMVMDELAHGIIMATAHGRVLHANQVARQELGRRRALVLHEGHLQAQDSTRARDFQDALARGANGRRSLVTLPTATGWTLSIAVVPLRREVAGSEPTLVLFLSRPAVCDSLMLCFFARTHGLTPSEEQVLSILCQGYSAPETARQLNVAVSTIRSHVRSMCAKTQANGVRALVGRVAVLPPLGAALHHPVH